MRNPDRSQMIYLTDLKFPLLISGLIFIVSVLNLKRIDFYAVVLTASYLILGSISNVGEHYLDLTGQRKSAKAALKAFIDPPGVFVLVLGLFYALTGAFHWILIGGTSFLTLIVFAINYSDWAMEKGKDKSQ